MHNVVNVPIFYIQVHILSSFISLNEELCYHSFAMSVYC